MDETTRRGLVKSTDLAIRQVRAELEKLQSFRAWVQEAETSDGAAVDAPTPEDVEHRTTADFIEQAFLAVGPRASLTIPEVVRAVHEVGWTTDSSSPETVIRTTVGRMGQDGKLETVPVEPNQARRFRLAGSR